MGGDRWLSAIVVDLWVWVVKDFVRIYIYIYIFVKVFKDYFNVLDILF